MLNYTLNYTGLNILYLRLACYAGDVLRLYVCICTQELLRVILEQAPYSASSPYIHVTSQLYMLMVRYCICSILR